MGAPEIERQSEPLDLNQPSSASSSHSARDFEFRFEPASARAETDAERTSALKGEIRSKMIKVSGAFHILEERLFKSKFLWSLFRISGMNSIRQLYDACILRMYYEYVKAKGDSNELIQLDSIDDQAFAEQMTKIDHSHKTLQKWKVQLSVGIDEQQKEMTDLLRNVFLKYPALLDGVASMLAHYAIRTPSHPGFEEWKKMAKLFHNAALLLESENEKIGDSIPKLAQAFERIASPVIDKFYEEKLDRQILLEAA
jgi:hypothetical protein